MCSPAVPSQLHWELAPVLQAGTGILGSGWEAVQESWPGAREVLLVACPVPWLGELSHSLGYIGSAILSMQESPGHPDSNQTQQYQYMFH